MLTKRHCADCGAMRPNEGPCPMCALRGALALSDKTSAPLFADNTPDQIGPYQLRQKLGEGGCGIVYLAEQSAPLRRQVALKIVKLGMDTRQVIARFENERHALALMEHQNIARVLDAGDTETGRPFFVMELVSGLRITDFCDEHALSIRERLALFIQVCHGIQHAHQKGVIHRDIKPSNILVAIQNGVTVPKVIDFGIAKAIQQSSTEQTSLTSAQQFIGTPAYMSPEQAGLSRSDVDTRSDIYSLGVLLYELLTAQAPFEKNDLLRASFDEMRRIVREKEPSRPSTRLSEVPAAAMTTIARQRGTDPSHLLGSLRGDLDWIVLKCLEKDRTRRYATANDLAADIERHLNDELVTAVAPSPFYRMSKLARRHRLGLATSAALFLLLSAGVVGSAWQAMRATRAEVEQRRFRAEAETQRRLAETALWDAQAQKHRAERALGSMEQQKAWKEIALQDSQQQRTNTLTALFVAQREKERAEQASECASNANARAEAALRLSRDHQANLEAVMNFMLFDLSDKLEPIGKLDLLRSVTEKVLAHYQSMANDDPSADSSSHRFTALKNLAHVLALQGDSAKAMQAYRTSLIIAEKLSIEDQKPFHWQGELCDCHRAIGNLLARRGEFAPAVVELDRSLQIAQRLIAQEPANMNWQALLQSCSVGMADALWVLGEKPRAFAVCRTGLKTALHLTELDPENLDRKRDLSASYNKLGSFLLQESDVGGARKACQGGLEIARWLAAKDPANKSSQIELAVSLDNLGDTLLADKEPGNALNHYNEALRIRQQMAQADPDNTEWQRDLLWSYFRVGRTLLEENKKSKLTELFQDSLKAMGNVHKKHLQLAQQLFSPDRSNPKSVAALNESLKLARQLADKDPANVEWQDNLAQSYSLAGDILFEAGEKTSSLEQYRQALQIRKDLAQRGSRAASLQIALALAHARLAATLEHLAQREEALNEARYALRTLRPLVSRWPGNMALLEMPVQNDSNPGVLSAMTSVQHAEFALAFKRGFEAAHPRKAAAPSDQSIQDDWANYCSEMAVLNLWQRDIAGAALQAEKAMKVRHELFRDNPSDLKSQLVEASISLCALQILNHQVPAAIKTAREGILLQPDAVALKGLLVISHLLRGEFDQAQPLLLENKNLQVGPRQTFAEAGLENLVQLRERGFDVPNRETVEHFLTLNSLQASQ